MFKQIALVATIVSATFVAASSITIPNVSSQCSNAVGDILASPQASCLNAGALLNLAISPNTSIVSSIDSWAQGMCTVSACSSSDLTAIMNNFTSGCLTDINNALSGFSLGSISASSIQSAVSTYYAPARQIACLKDNSANQLCVTQTLNNIQSLLGTLSLSNYMSVFQQAMSLTQVPANITCTSCVQATYVTLRTDFPSQVSQYGITTELNSVCPAGFTDGSTPSTVSEIAVNKNGAMRGSITGGAVMLVAAVFTFLA